MSILMAGWFLSAVAGSAAAQTRGAPPRILESRPSFWEVGVSPVRVKRMSLTFDQPMRAGTSAWLGRSSVLPETRMEDEISPDYRTMYLGVELQPGRVYVFALNEKQIPGVGFQSSRGISMPRQYLVFQTSGTPSADDAPPSLARTAPSNGETGVNPARPGGIELVFNRPMRRKTHGLILFEAGQRVNLGEVKFQWSDDGLTFRLPRPLLPRTSYRIQLNANDNIGFVSAQRIPLWPREFSFETGDLTGEARP